MRVSTNPGMIMAFALALAFIVTFTESHASCVTPCSDHQQLVSTTTVIADSRVTSPKHQLLIWCLMFHKECALTDGYNVISVWKHSVWRCQSLTAARGPNLYELMKHATW